MGKSLDKFIDMFRLKDDYDEYDDYDDYDDEFEDDDVEDIPAPVVKKKLFKNETTEPKKENTSFIKKAEKKEPVHKTPKTVPSRQPETKNKIVPLKSMASKGEVCVMRPQVFEDSRAISDVLMTGCAAVVNLEGIDLEVAQRIIDFICGSCYAMSGKIERISNYIFIVTPESIEISGDLQEVMTSGIRMPSFNDYF